MASFECFGCGRPVVPGIGKVASFTLKSDGSKRGPTAIVCSAACKEKMEERYRLECVLAEDGTLVAFCIELKAFEQMKKQ